MMTYDLLVITLSNAKLNCQFTTVFLFVFLVERPIFRAMPSSAKLKSHNRLLALIGEPQISISRHGTSETTEFSLSVFSGMICFHFFSER
jgi:hypothetical protein